MIAVRNRDQVLAVGNDAYEIFEKNPSNVSVISPVLGGKIADIDHTEMGLKGFAGKSRCTGPAGLQPLSCHTFGSVRN